MRALVFVALFAACLPARSPSSSYGEALKICDKQPSDDEWVKCCVEAAREYNRDPEFCFDE